MSHSLKRLREENINIIWFFPDFFVPLQQTTKANRNEETISDVAAVYADCPDRSGSRVVGAGVQAD